MGGISNSKTLKEAVQRSNDAGLLFVAAAGNEAKNNDRPTKAMYPASFKIDNVISVAAFKKDGEKAWFSNKGVKSVHLAAPGQKIYSTSPGGKYKVLSGTSMATPHVAGVAGLVLSVYPNLTASELKERILNNTTPLSSLKKKTITGGLLNAYEAVK